MSEPQQPDAAKPQWSGSGDSMFSTRSTAAASDTIATIIEREGRTIGRYKLLQLIGEGGFGSVFLAEQSEPVRRRVALKIIKPGMDSKMVAARFEAERQALALMDHPHIARVFDGGVTDASLGSRPYFVMEYVIGDPITNFADARKLPVRERLDLFTQVCDAVQHAHTKGIIHRDLKPGNILASMVDGRPYARVIDFGIAKATGSSLTDKTLFTEHRQLIGTPEYMSPEQAEGSPDIDTRTDVYALGVLLYELLTGATPFDASRLRSAAFAEMQRIIKEEDPPAPSMKLSRNLPALAATAAARQAEPGRLSTLIKGELDWISMKAIDKDRSRRYESPNQLAADVRRHLSGTAVLAAPPSAGYKLRKFVRKNRGAVVAAGAVTAALLVAIAGTTWGLMAQLRAARADAAQAASAQLDAYKARILAAQSSVREQQFAECGRRLAECPEKFRGWEWQLLSRYAASGVFRLPSGLGRAIVDNGRVFGFGDDGVHAWTTDGEPAEAPAWLEGSPRIVEVANATRRIVTANKGDVRTWERDGTPLGAHVWPFNVATAGWSRGSKFVVLVCDNVAQVFDANLRPAGTLITAPERIRWADVADDGRLALVGEKGDCRIWAADGGAILASAGSAGTGGSAAFSPGGDVILVRDGEAVRMYDTTPAYAGLIKTFAKTEWASFSPDGATMAVRESTSVQLYTSRGESIGGPLSLGGAAIRRAAFSPDGRRVLAVADSQMRLWDARGTPLSEPFAVGAAPLDVRFSPDSRRVLAVAPISKPDPGNDYASKQVGKRLTLWDTEGICRWTLDIPDLVESANNGYGVPDTTVEFSPDGKSVLALIPEGQNHRWFVVQPERSALPERSTTRVGLELAAEAATLGARASTPSPRLTFRANQGAVEVLDDHERVVGTLVGHSGEVRAMAVHPDGKRIATAGIDRTVRIWETSLWRQVAEFAVPNALDSLEFTPSGAQLILGEGAFATIWDTRSVDERRREAGLRAAEEAAAQKLVDDLLSGPRTLKEIGDELHQGAERHSLRGQYAAIRFDERQAEISKSATSLVEGRRKTYLSRANLAAHRDRGDVPERVWREVMAAEAAWEPDASALNSLSWDVVKHRGESRDRIEAAVELAREAVRLAPGDWQITNTLALALYRAEKYEESVAAFELSDREYARLQLKSDPAARATLAAGNQIGLAMCAWRLGNRDDALRRIVATEIQLRQAPKDAQSADDVSLMQEAKELVGAPPASP